MGSFGTDRAPSVRVIGVPSVGAVRWLKLGMRWLRDEGAAEGAPGRATHVGRAL